MAPVTPSAPTASRRAPLLLIVLTFLITPLFGCDELTREAHWADETDPSLEAGKADSGFLAAQEAQTLIAPVFDPVLCAYDREDPYEPGARFSKGPWIGECLDTEKRRPVHVLSAPSEKSANLELANVFHDGGFWYADIPTDAVYEVYFQLEYFPAVVPAGHTQIRIEFLEPVTLTGHSSWNLGRVTSTYNLVISAEAVPRVGDSYDLIKGMQDHFGLVYRVTTLAARYESMIIEQDHHVEQWRLQMTEEEKAELLVFYAYESEALGLEETYHTLFRNCTNELVRNIDGVVQYTAGEHIKKFLTKGTEFYPNIIRAALIARGLLPLDQSTDWYPLEEDPTFPEGE
ncbi:MAG: DUF4105 domain-containing protein [Myxococcota bacterium]|nr:DUF4105 domain-containing protein [Myxococcota bacterium]